VFPRWLASILIALTLFPAAAQAQEATPSLLPFPEELSSGNPARQTIALTFDAGAGAGPAPRILEVLRTKQVRSTFFLTGVWVRQNRALVQQIVDDGHEVANHTWDHRDLATASPAVVADEIGRAEELISGVTGKPAKPLFRFPYGSRNPRLLEQVAALGYRSIYWTIDSLDWMDEATVQSITNRVLNAARNGDIVLMHVGAAYTPAALPNIIDVLRARGYSLETVSEVAQ
jgi:peptidoglycan/xylan/chitin deacetylase (PgdA/CDA1 family)